MTHWMPRVLQGTYSTPKIRICSRVDSGKKTTGHWPCTKSIHSLHVVGVGGGDRFVSQGGTSVGVKNQFGETSVDLTLGGCDTSVLGCAQGGWLTEACVEVTGLYAFHDSEWQPMKSARKTKTPSIEVIYRIPLECLLSLIAPVVTQLN